MSIAINIFAAITALEFVYIFYLETIATTSAKTKKTFNLEDSDVNNKTVKVLLKNQGVYNLAIAILLFFALLTQNFFLMFLLFIYIIFVAIYGAMTSQKKILIMQGGTSIIGVVLCVVNYLCF